MVSREILQSHIDKIEQCFRHSDGELALQSHLSQLIEYKEVSEFITQNSQGHNTISEKDIYERTFEYLMAILQQRPLNGRLKDTRHELRLTSLTILSLFQNLIYEDEQNPARFVDLIKLCFEIYSNDSEEIAEIAVRILIQYFNMTQLAQRKVQLSHFEEQVVAFCKDFLEFVSQVPELAQNNTALELEQSSALLPVKLRNNPPVTDQNQKCFQTYGCRSLKLGARIIHQLLRQLWSPSDRSRVIDTVKESLFLIFECLPEDLQNSNCSMRLKAIPFFARGLEIMVILFHAVSYLMQNNIEFLRLKFGSVIKFFILLAQNLPGHATDQRHQLLVGFYTLYNTLFKSNADQEPTQGLVTTAKHVLLHYLDQLLEDRVLLGTGQVSVSILHESANIVYKLYQQLGNQMTSYQMVKAVQLLLHCLLNPLTPLILKSTIIFCLYRLNQEFIKKKEREIECPKLGPILNYDLQIEVLSSMSILCKQLREQAQQGVEWFDSQKNLEDDYNGSLIVDDESITDIFQLKEKELAESCNRSFQVSWKHICITLDQSRNSQQQQAQPGQSASEQGTPSTLTQKKEHFPRTVKNLFLFVENILILIQDLTEKPPLAPGMMQMQTILSLETMQLICKFFINGCHLIQYLSEMLPNDDAKHKEVCKSFQILLQRLPVSQFKDLLHATGDEFFGLIIEVKAKCREGGMALMVKYMMSFTSPQQNQQQAYQQQPNVLAQQTIQDDFVAVFLEMFFNYIKVKLPTFESQSGDQPVLKCGLSKQDIRLIQLPFKDVQEAMQKKLLRIGEETLHRANDIRVKHTFFAVFMFCIMQTRSGQIVPKYFTIIRNLLKDICNLDENSGCIKEIMRDFIPMFQGLLETFLQLKDEATYAKDINEICCLVPAKLKHLLDFLPAISKPLIDSMDSTQPEQVESGIHTIQYWLSALATYPELLDPVISQVLPDLNGSLKHLLFFMPNLSLKLMGKLGAKTRQYDKNNEFKPRNYSEDGLKICLTDRHSNEHIIFGIDAVIDVLLVKILSYGDCYTPSDLNQAVAFIKCAFLSYTDPDLDLDFIVASIIQAKSKQGTEMPGLKAPPLFQSFNAKEEQDPISQMTRGSESHVFEKILRCLIIGCSSLPTTSPELLVVQQQHVQFMKWVTKYFTLIYICKNGQLQNQNQLDEINPVLFIEYICEFLYFNIFHGSIKQKSKAFRSYYKGSSIAIKTMLRLLTTIYGDQPDALDNLEVIPLLIQKVCHQVQDLPKNLAVNIAIGILIKELPQRTLKKNCHVLLKTLFQILQQSSDSVVRSVMDEVKLTLTKLIQQIGVFEFKLQQIVQMEDRNIFNFVVDLVLQNVISSQAASRQTALHFLEEIARCNKITVLQLLKTPHKTAEKEDKVPMIWAEYLENEIEKRVKEVFEMFKGGYCQVQQLMQYIEIVQFILKHGDGAKVMDRLHVYIGIAEYMLILLEDECDTFEKVIELPSQNLNMGPNNSLQRLAKRYMKLERLYLTQNKEYDSYSHTMQSHQFLNTHFFEVSIQAKEQKHKIDLEKTNSKPSNIELKIFARPINKSGVFEKLSDEATRVLQGRDEVEGARRYVKKKLEDFAIKIFGVQSQSSDNRTSAHTPPRQQVPPVASNNILKVQDISYDYMHDLYEMYPNVRLHCQLACKMLELVSDIISHQQIWAHIKLRQSEFFESYPAGGVTSTSNVTNDEEVKQVGETVHLLTKFDFYLVEIKSKIICIYFKLFQRDERIIQKKSQACLKRLIKQETAPNEALPNFILKECVRPILNSMTSNRNQPSYFQSMGKLIKVLYSCFNEALGRHLTKNYETLEIQIKEPYVLHYNQNTQEQPQQPQLTRSQVQDEVTYLIDQYNIKIQQIETACGIINCLHYLCKQKNQVLPEMSEIMGASLVFEVFLIEEFQKRFDNQLNLVLGDMIKLKPIAYDRVSPLQIKLGYLRSDFRQGVANFYNLNFQEALKSLHRPSMVPPFLQMLGQRENFCLRERLSRDQQVRQIIHNARNTNIVVDGLKFDEKYVLAINLVYIFSKFYPQYLFQQRNTQILDGLREKWINKVQTDQLLLSDSKNLYMKIQKSLVIYCKNDNSDMQILFDLLKDFQLSSISLDMRPLITLCTRDIPLSTNDSKKARILDSALNKIQTSQCKYEAKYTMFEFAFMPIALQCAKSQEVFNQFFNEKLIMKFIETFFLKRSRITYAVPAQVIPNTATQQQSSREEWVWVTIHTELEQRQKVSYQSFFTEIIKVLTIILRFTQYNYFLKCCPAQDCMPIFHFLDWVVKNTLQSYTADLILKEHAFYTLSCFGVRMLGLVPAGCESVGDTNMQNAHGSDQISVNLLNLLSLNVLAPLFEYDLTKTVSKFLIQNTFTNLLKIFEDPRVQQIAQSEQTQTMRKQFNVWQYFKRRFSLKPQQHTRMALCTLVAKQYQLLEVEDRGVFRRLYKTVEQFVKFGSMSVDTLSECKDPLMIIDTLLQECLKRKTKASIHNSEVMSEIYYDTSLLHSITTKLFETQLLNMQAATSHTQSYTKLREHFKTFADHCFTILKTIITSFPKPNAYYHQESQAFQNINDPDKSLLKSIFKLNLCALGIYQGYDFARNFKILIDFFKESFMIVHQRSQQQNVPSFSFSSTNYRLILFPINLISTIIRKKDRLMMAEQIAELQYVLKKAMEFDVKKSNDRDIKYLQGQLVREFLKQQQINPAAVSGPATSTPSVQQFQSIRNDEMRVVQRCLPHLSIRLIYELEKLRDEGYILHEDFSNWVDTTLYKDINNSIFRLVSAFRLVVCQEKLPVEGGQANQEPSSYLTITFPDGACEFKIDDPNFDVWIKESLMIALKSIAKHMKTNMHQDEAFLVFDQLKSILKAFQNFKICQYLLEQLFIITEILVVDQPQHKVKLIANKKATQLLMLTQVSRLKELSDAKENKDSLINKVYTLCLDFLETQPSLLQNDISLRIFDRLFLLKPCCAYPITQRMHQVFEKFMGSSLKAKLSYFMQKVTSEDPDQFMAFCQINNLLDFTLFNFRQDISLYKIRESSRLIAMHSKACRFVGIETLTNHESYTRITCALGGFLDDHKIYKKYKLENLLEPLSEIIRINPEHSHDKNIAEKIFSKIFWQYWQKMLSRQDHLILAADFNKMLQNLIKFESNITPQVKTQFARTMLEQIVALKNPQVRVEPEVLQYMGKHLNLWHIAIPQLEDQVNLWPQNERIVHSLHELYSGLMEEDLSSGLSRICTQSNEMRSLISLGQHHMWEQLNSQFGNYINYYAEQEGLFSYLETQQQTPGKYSRQLSKNGLINMVIGVDPLLNQTKQVPSNSSFSEVFESDAANKMNQSFPKPGGNRLISEIDLRTWETLYVQSLKILKKTELFKDVADNMSNVDLHELKIDFLWQVKDMRQLRILLQNILVQGGRKVYHKSDGSIQKLRYHLYQNYILGTQGEKESRNFDENFKETIKLAIKQWSEYLPSYMDRIQYEYLILFQQIMESNEGGRNMISIQEMKRLSDYRCAMNIWRERLPHLCESIGTWQDILENRNYIFTKLRDNILKQQVPNEEGKLSIGAQEEPVDICWNNLKLASVSRKHGLFNLAKSYLEQCKTPLLDPDTKGDILKLERFKYRYETFKLQIVTSMDSAKQQEMIHDSIKFLDCQDYDLWMHAEILRLQGEFWLSRGDLVTAKAKLIQSIEKNKKEAKTWLAYARLNEIEHAEKKDEKSIQNALKGYFCAIALVQHKSRLIIPYLLRLFKAKRIQTSKQLVNFVKLNVDQLPCWLWIFWIPQLLQILKQTPNNSVSHETAKTIYTKLSRLYPQPSFYPLRAIAYHQKKKDWFKSNTSLQDLYKMIPQCLRKQNPKLLEGIEQIIQSFSLVFKSSSDENFLSYLQSILNFSQFLLQPPGIEQNLCKFFEFIYKMFLSQGQEKPLSPQLSQLQKQFYTHLINPETMTTDILQQMKILKNIKDYLLIQKNLKEQQLHLEDVFPQLTNIQCKGIELPDQYVLNSSEPLPEKVLTIERLDSVVHRTGVNEKKIQFRCNNDKSYAYTISTFQNSTSDKEYCVFLSDERVTQLKIISNMLFTKHKESMRRGLKFHAAPKILLPGSKLCQDDLTFTDFQETHDYLLHEQGVDPDMALKMQLELIERIFSTYPQDKPRDLSTLNQAQVSSINLATYQQMRQDVPDHLLQSYFHRIFYNVDNLFIFKKQFTKYHAINSLFAYAFNQSDYLALNKLFFCKASGRLNFTETKLNVALQNPQAFKKQSFEDIEEDFFKNKDVQNLNYLPFRLTPNFEYFIGKIALNGLYAGVLTSASMAIASQESKFKALLKLIFSDEILPIQEAQEMNDQATEDLVMSNADLIMFKIKSLSQHRRVIVQPPKSENLKMSGLNHSAPGISEDKATGNIVLGATSEHQGTQVPKEFFDLEMDKPNIPEEFNKKVFALIQMAQDDARRSQRAINWCAWF